MHSDTTTWRNHQKSEWCGEFINSDNPTMMSLAKRFNLTLVDEIAAQPKGSFDTLYFDGRYYSQAQSDRDFVPVNAVLQQQVNAAPFPTTYNSIPLRPVTTSIISAFTNGLRNTCPTVTIPSSGGI